MEKGKKENNDVKEKKDIKLSKKKAHRPVRWDKLDNTAHLFPVIAGENMTNVFRLSVTLKEEVQPDKLQEALDILLPRFNAFNLQLRMGMFWYYFEENGGAAPRVQEEDMFPCRYVHPSKVNHYMFRVIYYRNRISLEVFHVLTDGMGGMNFLRELLYQYLRLVHPELRETAGEKLYEGTSFNREDSFTKNYKKKKTGNSYKKEKAYRIKLEKLPKGEFGVMHGMVPISQLKPITKKYGVSINEYLVALFAWSTYVECLKKMPSDKPIRVAVPVNLRPYFNSMTTKNFFAMVTAEFFPKKEEYTFEEVVEIIKDSLRKQINKEHLEEVFSYGVSNQQNKMLRIVPLVIKNVAMKFVYGRSALSSSTTITNVGKVDVDPLYEPYIEMFYAFLPMSKGQELKGTVNSYKDTLVFTFSSVFTDTCIQRTFFRKMAEEGMEVAIETNGVYDA